jgi:hypothetical protein
VFWHIILKIHLCPALNLMFGCITLILSWNVLWKMNTLLFSHPYIIICMTTVFLPWRAHLFQFFCLVSLSIHLQKTASLPCFLFFPIWLFTEVTIIWSVLIYWGLFHELLHRTFTSVTVFWNENTDTQWVSMCELQLCFVFLLSCVV